MDIYKWKDVIKQRLLGEITERLLQGEVMVYPTETAYGIGADPRNLQAINKVLKIKQREASHMLPLIASSTSQVQNFFYMTNSERQFVSNHWPGPYTIILRPKSWQGGLSLAYDTVAVRVSGACLARSIARRLGSPIISTSANLSGNQTLYNIDEVLSEFKGNKYQPDFYIDAGRLPKRRPSRIVRFEDDKKIIVRK